MAEYREEENEEDETFKANADIKFLVQKLDDSVLLANDFKHLRQSNELIVRSSTLRSLQDDITSESEQPLQGSCSSMFSE